jgi:hypothetical protein
MGWQHSLQTLAMHRWIDLSSVWRLHRLWLEQNAVDDLPGTDVRRVETNGLYRYLDKALPTKWCCSII